MRPSAPALPLGVCARMVAGHVVPPPLLTSLGDSGSLKAGMGTAIRANAPTAPTTTLMVHTIQALRAALVLARAPAAHATFRRPKLSIQPPRLPAAATIPLPPESKYHADAHPLSVPVSSLPRLKSTEAFVEALLACGRNPSSPPDIPRARQLWQLVSSGACGRKVQINAHGVATMLSLLARADRVPLDLAEAVLAAAPTPLPAPCANAMLKVYAACKPVPAMDAAGRLFRAMVDDGSATTITINSMMSVYAKCGQVDAAEGLWRGLLNGAFGPHVLPCIISVNTAMAMYNSAGRHADAVAVWESMVDTGGGAAAAAAAAAAGTPCTSPPSLTGATPAVAHALGPRLTPTAITVNAAITAYAHVDDIENNNKSKPARGHTPTSHRRLHRLSSKSPGFTTALALYEALQAGRFPGASATTSSVNALLCAAAACEPPAMAVVTRMLDHLRGHWNTPPDARGINAAITALARCVPPRTHEALALWRDCVVPTSGSSGAYGSACAQPNIQTVTSLMTALSRGWPCQHPQVMELWAAVEFGRLGRTVYPTDHILSAVITSCHRAPGGADVATAHALWRRCVNGTWRHASPHCLHTANGMVQAYGAGGPQWLPHLLEHLATFLTPNDVRTAAAAAAAAESSTQAASAGVGKSGKRNCASVSSGGASPSKLAAVASASGCVADTRTVSITVQALARQGRVALGKHWLDVFVTRGGVQLDERAKADVRRLLGVAIV